MLNQVVMVGRIVADPKVIENEEGKQVCNVTIAVPRSYKNINGEYDTDFIDVTLFNGIAQNTVEYCKKGDLVGIKGRIQTNEIVKDDEKNKYTNVVAEKVTFLSSRTNTRDESELERE